MKRGKISLIIKFVGLVLFCYILFKYLDYNKVSIYLTNSKFVYLIFAILNVFPLYFIKSLRLYYLIKQQGLNYNIWKTTYIYFCSNFLGFITPGRIGEFAKALYLKEDLNIDLTQSLPTIIIDRIFDVYVLIILTLLGIINYNIFDKFSTALYIAIVIIIILPLFLYIKRIDNFFIKFFHLPEKYQKGVITIIYISKSILNIKSIIISFITTIIAYLVLFYQSYLIALFLNIYINFKDIIYIMSITNILSFLPISFSGFGTREVSLVYFFSILNIDKSLAIVFSFFILFVFNIIGGAFGFIFWIFKPINIGKIKKHRMEWNEK